MNFDFLRWNGGVVFIFILPSRTSNSCFSIRTHIMGFPDTAVPHRPAMCVLIMLCLVHVKAHSVFEFPHRNTPCLKNVFAYWEHTAKKQWTDRLVSLLPFTLTLTPIRQRQSGSLSEIQFSNALNCHWFPSTAKSFSLSLSALMDLEMESFRKKNEIQEQKKIEL